MLQTSTYTLTHIHVSLSVYNMPVSETEILQNSTPAMDSVLCCSFGCISFFKALIVTHIYQPLLVSPRTLSKSPL